MATHPTSPETTLLPGDGAAVRSFRVDVLTGPDAGGSLIGQAGARVVVGTHRTADLVLSDPTVSRFHCELVVDGDAVALRDLGSRNRTVIDSVELEAGRLLGPTIVTIGQTELRIDLLAESVPVPAIPQEHFGALVGASAVMRAVFAQLTSASAVDSNLLIEGERGAGKDAAAAAVHEASARHGGPLDVIDCAGPALEVEEQLFGKRDRAGALERCHRGTLLLDDVGSLARGTQRTLVRAIEGRAVHRIGTHQAVATDVRLIGLSRRNLRIDVNAERFRADLFEALAVLRVRLPPLRERPEDVPLLVATLLDRLSSRDTRVGIQLLGAESIEQLRSAPWLGNVRELRAHVERAVAAAATVAPGDGDDQVAAVPLIDGSMPLREARQRWVRYFERAYLTDLLARAGGSVSAAAILAGVDRVHLHRLIAQCGLRSPRRPKLAGDPDA